MLFQKYIQTHICIYIHSPHRCLELKSRNSFSFGGLGLPLQGYVRVILAINTPATCMEHHRGTCQGMDQLKEMRAKLRRLKWTTGGGQELSMGRFGMACLCVHSCLQLYKWTIVIAFCFIFWNFWKFTTFRGYWCHWCLCWRPKTSWWLPGVEFESLIHPSVGRISNAWKPRDWNAAVKRNLMQRFWKLPVNASYSLFFDKM